MLSQLLARLYLYGRSSVTSDLTQSCIQTLNTTVCAGYFDAPGTRQAPLGGAGGQRLKADLPSVTLVFSAMDGLKAMQVNMPPRTTVAPCCAVLCCAVLCCAVLCCALKGCAMLDCAGLD